LEPEAEMKCLSGVLTAIDYMQEHPKDDICEQYVKLPDKNLHFSSSINWLKQRKGPAD